MSDVLAVDAGGTGVRALRTAGADGAGTRLHAPPVAIDDGLDVDALVAAVRPLAQPPPAATCWAVRGMSTLTDPQQLHARLRDELGARATVVVADALAGLVGAHGGVRPGVVLAAGSGAVVFATDLDRVWRRIDGWGHVLGDRGSGAWIGREGLAAALAAADDVPGGSSALLARARARFGDELTWPRRVMGTRDATAVLASFAPEVDAAAGECTVAADVLQRAADRLADALVAGTRALPGAPVTVTGRLLDLPHLREAFAARLADRALTPAPALGDALDGARIVAEFVAAGGRLETRLPYLVADRGDGPKG